MESTHSNAAREVGSLVDAEIPGFQPAERQRLITLRERLRGFRSELSEGQVSALAMLDREPDSDRIRQGAGYAIRIETDIWSFANAIAGLCLKQSDMRRNTEG